MNEKRTFLTPSNPMLFKSIIALNKSFISNSFSFSLKFLIQDGCAKIVTYPNLLHLSITSLIFIQLLFLYLSSSNILY